MCHSVGSEASACWLIPYNVIWQIPMTLLCPPSTTGYQSRSTNQSRVRTSAYAHMTETQKLVTWGECLCLHILFCFLLFCVCLHMYWPTRILIQLLNLQVCAHHLLPSSVTKVNMKWVNTFKTIKVLKYKERRMFFPKWEKRTSCGWFRRNWALQKTKTNDSKLNFSWNMHC